SFGRGLLPAPIAKGRPRRQPQPRLEMQCAAPGRISAGARRTILPERSITPAGLDSNSSRVEQPAQVPIGACARCRLQRSLSTPTGLLSTSRAFSPAQLETPAGPLAARV